MREKTSFVCLFCLVIVIVLISMQIPKTACAETPIRAFNLTSAITDSSVPFTVGLGFKKGDVTGTPTLDIQDYQIVVKRRWNDNTIKHVIASGRVPMTASTAKTIMVSNSTTGPAGTNLTASDIAAASPSASVQCGSIGTVSLSSLLSSPVRTWISGPEMAEAHYRGSVGSDTTLQVWFHVRYYKGGKVWIRAIVENGFINVAGSTKSYIPTVTIGGTVVYNNGGATLSHYGHTRWSAEGWIGTSDPQVTMADNTVYLMASRLVPNYWKMNPGSATLNGLTQTYSPMQQGQWTTNMGETGFQNQIGLLPLWDALYLNSYGDSRAFKSVMANTKSLNSYPIVWNDGNTKNPIILSSWGTWTVEGANGGGATGYSAGPLTWDVAHHGSGGYLAYLLTGDYYYLETMEDQASMCYLMNTSSTYYDPTNGNGTARNLSGQTRAVAWCQRTIGQLAGIGPSGDAVVAEYVSLLSSNVNRWNTERQRAGQNLLGYLYSYELPSGGYGTGVASPWQQHFWVQSYGHISDLEPFPDMTNLNAVRGHLYKSAVGILGANGTDNYCFTRASEYAITIASSNDPDATNWYDSWGTVFQATTGSPNTSCGSTLQGSSGGAPNLASTGYWGNLLPAIAYAVDHGAPGATASWARLTGATNWSSVENSGFENTPVWGIVPRTVISPPKTPSYPKGLIVR